MFHKILKSYHNNDPWDDSEEHPDGLLWLLTPEELEDMPRGLRLETTKAELVFIGKHDIDTSDKPKNGYISYGIRGHRDD